MLAVAFLFVVSPCTTTRRTRYPPKAKSGGRHAHSTPGIPVCGACGSPCGSRIRYPCHGRHATTTTTACRKWRRGSAGMRGGGRSRIGRSRWSARGMARTISRGGKKGSEKPTTPRGRGRRRGRWRWTGSTSISRVVHRGIRRGSRRKRRRTTTGGYTRGRRYRSPGTRDGGGSRRRNRLSPSCERGRESTEAPPRPTTTRSSRIAIMATHGMRRRLMRWRRRRSMGTTVGGGGGTIHMTRRARATAMPAVIRVSIIRMVRRRRKPSSRHSRRLRIGSIRRRRSNILSKNRPAWLWDTGAPFTPMACLRVRRRGRGAHPTRTRCIASISILRSTK